MINFVIDSKISKNLTKAADFVMEFGLLKEFTFLEKKLEANFIRYYGRYVRYIFIYI